MEILRTDGGGRTINPPRLIKVVGNVMTTLHHTNPIWKNIKSIHDNKGAITISLYSELIDSMAETYLLYLFMKEWNAMKENPDNVFIEAGKDNS